MFPSARRVSLPGVCSVILPSTVKFMAWPGASDWLREPESDAAPAASAEARKKALIVRRRGGESARLIATLQPVVSAAGGGLSDSLLRALTFWSLRDELPRPY